MRNTQSPHPGRSPTRGQHGPGPRQGARPEALPRSSSHYHHPPPPLQRSIPSPTITIKLLTTQATEDIQAEIIPTPPPSTSPIYRVQTCEGPNRPRGTPAQQRPWQQGQTAGRTPAQTPNSTPHRTRTPETPPGPLPKGNAPQGFQTPGPTPDPPSSRAEQCPKNPWHQHPHPGTGPRMTTPRHRSHNTNPKKKKATQHSRAQIPSPTPSTDSAANCLPSQETSKATEQEPLRQRTTGMRGPERPQQKMREPERPQQKQHRKADMDEPTAPTKPPGGLPHPKTQQNHSTPTDHSKHSCK
ncbi:PREDICTED: proteoglycan 4-like, partial [Cyprinodon variegatus]|uniref:proteoglycan 4-like n=1 Tax=Cyprinodon variegatus TaxID=28743 RepID=UPI00074281BA